MSDLLPLSVVVVMHNGANDAIACLSSVAEHVRCEHEAIVLDNASSDGSAGRVRVAHPDAVVIESPLNVGFAAGANRAAAHARGKYLLVLNQDARLLSDVQPALELLEREPDVGAVGARMQDRHGAYRPSAGHFPVPWRLARLTRLYRSTGPFASGSFPRRPRSYEVDWVEGSFLMTRADVWRALDGFDPGYFMYVEDVDYCRRLRDAGLSTRFVPSVRYLHDGGFEPRRIRWIAFGLRRYHGRHSGFFMRALANLVLDTGLVARAAVSGVRGALGHHEDERVRARACIDAWRDRGVERAPRLDPAPREPRAK